MILWETFIESGDDALGQQDWARAEELYLTAQEEIDSEQCQDGRAVRTAWGLISSLLEQAKYTDSLARLENLLTLLNLPEDEHYSKPQSHYRLELLEAIDRKADSPELVAFCQSKLSQISPWYESLNEHLESQSPPNHELQSKYSWRQGLVKLAQGEATEAEDLFRLSLEYSHSGPHSHKARLELINILLQQQRWSEIIEILTPLNDPILCSLKTATGYLAGRALIQSLFQTNSIDGLVDFLKKQDSPKGWQAESISGLEPWIGQLAELEPNPLESLRADYEAVELWKRQDPLAAALLKLAQNGDLPAATQLETVLEQILPEKSSAASVEVLSSASFSLADYWLSDEASPKGALWLERGLELQESTLDESDSAQVSALLPRQLQLAKRLLDGNQSTDQGAEEKAEKLLRRSLSLAEKTGLGKSKISVELLLATAHLFEKRGRKLQTEGLLKKALSVQESLTSPSDSSLLPLLNQLATLFGESKDRKQRNEMLKRICTITGDEYIEEISPEDCINQARAALKSHDASAADTALAPLANWWLGDLPATLPEFDLNLLLMTRANVLEASENWEEAISTRKRALEILLRPDHPQRNQAWPSGLYLAEWSIQNRQDQEAQATLSKLFQLLPHCVPADAADIGRAWKLQAALSRNQNRTQQALDSILKASVIFSESLEAGHPDRLECTRAQALLQSELGNLPEAHRLLAELLDSETRLFGPEYRDLCITHSMIAELHLVEGKYVEAEACFREALRTGIAALGPNHANIAATRCNLGQTLLNQARYPEAQEELQASLALYQEVAELQGDPSIVRCQSSLGVVLCKQDQLSEGLQWLNTARSSATELFGSEDLEVAFCSYHIAQGELVLGNLTAAVQASQQGLLIRTKILGRSHPETGQSLQQCALLLCKVGQAPKALEKALESMSIQEKALGPQHPEMTPALLVVLSIQRDMQLWSDCEQTLSRLAQIQEAHANQDLCKTLKHLCEVQLLQQKTDIAASTLERLWTLPEIATNLSLLELNQVRVLWANRELQAANIKEAEALFRQSMDEVQKASKTWSGEQQELANETVANSLAGMAKIFEHQGKAVHCDSLFLKACQTCAAQPTVLASIARQWHSALVASQRLADWEKHATKLVSLGFNEVLSAEATEPAAPIKIEVETVAEEPASVQAEAPPVAEAASPTEEAVAPAPEPETMPSQAVETVVSTTEVQAQPEAEPTTDSPATTEVQTTPDVESSVDEPQDAPSAEQSAEESIEGKMLPISASREYFSSIPEPETAPAPTPPEPAQPVEVSEAPAEQAPPVAPAEPALPEAAVIEAPAAEISEPEAPASSGDLATLVAEMRQAMVSNAPFDAVAMGSKLKFFSSQPTAELILAFELLAEIFEQQSSTVAVLNCLEECLMLSDSLNGPASAASMGYLERVAKAAFLAPNYSRSEKAWIRLIELRGKESGAQSAPVAQAMLGLARCYVQLKHPQAMALLSRALKTLQALAPDHQQLVGLACFEIASLLVSQGREMDALSYYKHYFDSAFDSSTNPIYSNPDDLPRLKVILPVSFRQGDLEFTAKVLQSSFKLEVYQAAIHDPQVIALVEKFEAAQNYPKVLELLDQALAVRGQKPEEMVRSVEAQEALLRKAVSVSERLNVPRSAYCQQLLSSLLTKPLQEISQLNATVRCLDSALTDLEKPGQLAILVQVQAWLDTAARSGGILSALELAEKGALEKNSTLVDRRLKALEGDKTDVSSAEAPALVSPQPETPVPAETVTPDLDSVEAETVQSKTVAVDPVVVATQLLKKADELFRQHQIKEAEQELQESLKLLSGSAPNQNSSLLASVYALLGRCNQSQKRWVEAELNLRKGFDLCNQRFGPDHDLTLQALFHQADCYREQRKYDTAESFFVRLVETYRRKGQSQLTTPLAQCYLLLAHIKSAQKQYQAAHEWLEKCAVTADQTLDWSEMGAGETQIDAGLQLAALNCRQDKSDAALEILSGLELHVGPPDPQVALDRAAAARNRKFLELRILTCEILLQQQAFSQSEESSRSAISTQTPQSQNLEASAVARLQSLWAQSLARLVTLDLNSRKLEVGGAPASAADTLENPTLKVSRNHWLAGQNDPVKLEEARVLYEQSLSGLWNLHGEDHEHVASCLEGLARVEITLGHWEEAEERLNRSLAIREKTCGPNHPNTAETLRILASLYEMDYRYDLAETTYKRVWECIVKSMGSDHPAVALCMESLGNLYCQQGRYVASQALYERALELLDKVLGAEHPQKIPALLGIAQVHLYQSVLSQADQNANLAKKLAETHYGIESIEFSEALHVLGDIARLGGRYSEARNSYQESMRLRHKLLGQNHQKVGQSLLSIGHLSQDLGQLEVCERFLTKAIQIFESQLGPNHPYVADALQALGILYRATGKGANSELFLKRSMEIRTKTLGNEHPDIANSLFYLGQLYLDLRNDNAAEALLVRGLEIREKCLRSDHPGIAAIQVILARMYRSQEKYAEAEPFFRRVLEHREKTFGAQHQETAVSLRELAELCQLRGQRAQAETLHRQALDILEKRLGPSHPSLLPSLYLLSELYQSAGLAKESDVLQNRIADIEKTHTDQGLEPWTPNSDRVGYRLGFCAALTGWVFCRSAGLGAGIQTPGRVGFRAVL